MLENLNWSAFTESVLALMIWREHRSRGRQAMLACGLVAWNRHKKWNRDLLDILVEDGQFTSINPPGKTYDLQLDIWPAKGNKLFEIAMEVAAEIMDGEAEDLTHGALYYANLEHITPNGWFQKNILDRPGEHPKTASVFEHTFYA